MTSPERPVIVAANWKMHAPDVGGWLAAFQRARERRAGGPRVVLFPPFPLFAAATAVIAQPKSAAERKRPFIPEFRADRPFLFLIRDRDSGTILFLGRVMQPG